MDSPFASVEKMKIEPSPVTQFSPQQIGDAEILGSTPAVIERRWHPVNRPAPLQPNATVRLDQGGRKGRST